MAEPLRVRSTVSIVTVTFNDLVGLQRTVASVEAQSTPPHQHIVIDGHSTDGSRTWLQGLPAKSWRKIVSEPDEGIYDAMNKGTRAASGELVLYLNAGDVLHDASVLERVQVDRVQRGWDWGYGIISRFSGASYTGQSSSRPLRLQRYVWGKQWIPHQAAFLPRARILHAGGYNVDYGVAADQALMMKLALNDMPAFLPFVVCDFQNGGAHSLVSAWKRDLLWHRIRVDLLGKRGSAVLVDLARTRAITVVTLSRRTAGRALRAARRARTDIAGA